MTAPRLFRLLAAVVLLVGLGFSGWTIAGQVQAWRHLRAGREALEREDAEAARPHLAECVRTWPSNAEVRFLAAQAARRCGELDEARKQLRVAAELGWVEQAIDLERALLRVQQGELPAVEDFLSDCVKREHPNSDLILEILTPAYLRNFQLHHASQCVDRWLELRPKSAMAWYSKGLLAERKLSPTKAAEAYQEAVGLDPARRGFRVALARVLLDANRPSEARPHLEELQRLAPEDVEGQVLLGRCLHRLDERDRAIEVLDAVLSRQSEHGDALCLRGQLELDRGQPQQAALYLRRAVQRQPLNREALYGWLRCLQRGGKPEEVETCRKRLEECDAALARLDELTREIAQRPDDADLRFRAGEIYLKAGEDGEGLRWLLSALAARPDHRATHRLLAQTYQRQGKAELAARHQRMAQQ